LIFCRRYYRRRHFLRHADAPAFILLRPPLIASDYAILSLSPHCADAFSLLRRIAFILRHFISPIAAAADYCCRYAITAADYAIIVRHVVATVTPVGDYFAFAADFLAAIAT